MDATERIERRLKLHELRVLMSVVDGGSMGKAAKNLQRRSPLCHGRSPTSNIRSACAFSIVARTASCRRPMAAPSSDGASRLR
jgi:hypothetical protein